jgi:hypothetical protein
MKQPHLSTTTMEELIQKPPKPLPKTTRIPAMLGKTGHECDVTIVMDHVRILEPISNYK